VTVVPTVEASNVPPRVRLNVTDTGTPALFSVTVTRLNPDGTTSVVRTGDGNPLSLTTSGSTRVGLLYDYEMPFGASVSYSTTASAGTVSAQVTVAASQVWLIHPGVPALSMPITVAAWGERTRKVTRGVFYPMGRGTPVVQTDGARKSAEYDLSVYTASQVEREKLNDLLDSGDSLLLNVPATKGWGRPTEYVSVGDVAESSVTRMAGEPGRMWSLPVTVVDAPVGGSQSQRTLADLFVYPSLGSLMTAYPTFQALLAGP
jgi:hypothetical protein